MSLCPSQEGAAKPPRRSFLFVFCRVLRYIGAVLVHSPNGFQEERMTLPVDNQAAVEQRVQQAVARLAFTLTLVGVFAMAARFVLDGDTFWHLRAGAWIWEHRALPWVDRFSYTRFGHPWHYPGWPVELLMLALYRLGGLPWLFLWMALTVTAAYAALWPVLEGGPWLRAGVVLLSAAAAGLYWAARPYLVTFLGAALFLWALEGYRLGRGARRLAVLPLWMLFWVNSHGGFFMGFALWGAYVVPAWARWLWKRISYSQHSTPTTPKKLLPLKPLHLTGLGILAASLMNPYGPEMLAYPFKTFGMRTLRQIAEWQSPDFHQVQTWPFLVMVLLLWVALGLSRRPLVGEHALLLLGLGGLAFLAVRNVALFALGAALPLARHAADALAPAQDWLSRRFPRRKPPRPRPALNAALLAALLLLALLRGAMLWNTPALDEALREAFPVDAVAYLKAHRPPGRLFNSYNMGAYLIWALPEYPVFVDGRTDLYGDEILGQWFQVVRADPGWQRVLARWDVHTVLIEPDLPLARVLPHEGWEEVYQDKSSVILVRR